MDMQKHINQCEPMQIEMNPCKIMYIHMNLSKRGLAMKRKAHLVARVPEDECTSEERYFQVLLSSATLRMASTAMPNGIQSDPKLQHEPSRK